MLDAFSVITEATKNCVKQLAAEYEVGLRRMYEILGTDCVYPKVKRLIRAIARYDQNGVRLIKADLDALFCEVLTPDENNNAPTTAEIHKELNDVISARLNDVSRPERLRECREAVALLNRKICALEQENEPWAN